MATDKKDKKKDKKDKKDKKSKKEKKSAKSSGSDNEDRKDSHEALALNIPAPIPVSPTTGLVKPDSTPAYINTVMANAAGQSSNPYSNSPSSKNSKSNNSSKNSNNVQFFPNSNLPKPPPAGNSGNTLHPPGQGAHQGSNTPTHKGMNTPMGGPMGSPNMQGQNLPPAMGNGTPQNNPQHPPNGGNVPTPPPAPMGKGGYPPQNQWGGPQYDQWGQPMPQYDQWGQPMPQYDQWGQPKGYPPQMQKGGYPPMPNGKGYPGPPGYDHKGFPIKGGYPGEMTPGGGKMGAPNANPSGYPPMPSPNQMPNGKGGYPADQAYGQMEASIQNGIMSNPLSEQISEKRSLKNSKKSKKEKAKAKNKKRRRKKSSSSDSSSSSSSSESDSDSSEERRRQRKKRKKMPGMSSKTVKNPFLGVPFPYDANAKNPPSGNYNQQNLAAIGIQENPELAEGLLEWAEDSKIDEDAFIRLRCMTVEYQRRILLKGPLGDCANPSNLLIARIRDVLKHPVLGAPRPTKKNRTNEPSGDEMKEKMEMKNLEMKQMQMRIQQEQFKETSEKIKEKGGIKLVSSFAMTSVGPSLEEQMEQQALEIQDMKRGGRFDNVGLAIKNDPSMPSSGQLMLGNDQMTNAPNSASKASLHSSDPSPGQMALGGAAVPKSGMPMAGQMGGQFQGFGGF